MMNGVICIERQRRTVEGEEGEIAPGCCFFEWMNRQPTLSSPHTQSCTGAADVLIINIPATTTNMMRRPPSSPTTTMRGAAEGVVENAAAAAVHTE